LRKIGAGDEAALGAGAARMHHAFGNSLAIEAREFFDQVEIFEEHAAIRTRRLRVLVVPDWRTAVLSECRHVGGKCGRGEQARHAQSEDRAHYRISLSLVKVE